MALELKLNQKLSQTLVMTPQLQQAIKLLQLGRQEYLEVIEQELLENPVLEEAGDDGDATTSAQDEFVEQVVAQSLKEEPKLLDNAELLDFYNSHAEQLSASYSASQQGHDDTRPSIEATVGNPEGLTSHLLWQLRTSELNAEDNAIALQIIGNLDRNGYLESSVEEIALECQRTPEDIEKVLAIIQLLDPVGIAARDLRECLLIQLEQIGEVDSLAWRIVSDHLALLEVRKIEDIAKFLGVTVGEVVDAVKMIRSLEPRPGRPFAEEVPIYITPDVYVKKVDGRYVILLNDVGVPRLRLSMYYQNLLESAQRGEENKSEQVYLQDKVRAAAWLIKSIDQRQQTIFKVTQSIIKFQNEFLELGVSKLKPLVLRDVADDVGLHESTVSRVTTNKYVHTPQGVYELKFFFTSGLSSDEGQISSESVKERIRELVAGESQKKPLSDQALADILKKEGIDIARRTVAKYREMLNILSSSRRKNLF